MAEGERQLEQPVRASGALPAAAGHAPAASFLALQQGAGNAAFCRSLARAPGQPPGTAPNASAKTAKGLTKDDFDPVSFDPSIGTPNQLEAKPGAGDTVDLTAPEVTANAKVKMHKVDPPAAAPGQTAPPDKPKQATVGFVQTVLSSRRTFLYTEDGTPGGKVGVELRDAVPDGTRDARAATGQTAPGGGPVEGSGFKPFYQQPRVVSQDQETDVVFTDHTTQSGIKLTLKGTDDKNYTLSQVAGGDRFRLSVGAIDGGGGSTDPIHLAAKEWSVPWDMTLDASHHAMGGKISKEDYQGKLEDISPAGGWSDKDAQQFRWPRDEAEAEKLDTASLIKGIPYAERWDVNAWMMMCRVLRGRNPGFSIKVNMKENPDIYSQIGLSIKGPRTASRSAREWGTGDQTFGFRMLDLFDPQDLKVGMTLQIEVTRDGGSVNTFPWNWPFAQLQPVRVAWSKKGDGETPRGTMTDAERKGSTEVTTEMILTGTPFG